MLSEALVRSWEREPIGGDSNRMQEAVAIAESWSPHRTLASLYLWEAVHAE